MTGERTLVIVQLNAADSVVVAPPDRRAVTVWPPTLVVSVPESPVQLMPEAPTPVRLNPAGKLTEIFPSGGTGLLAVNVMEFVEVLLINKLSGWTLAEVIAPAVNVSPDTRPRLRW